tara:strand:+ start:334 stop:729 length:396 start_codon:yes stop_codon:yes gene_type:complete
MRRSSGKKRAKRTRMVKPMRNKPMSKKPMRKKPMRKKPMRKKTTKKGKNPWLEHAGKVFAELRKQDPKISYKQAMIEAKKTYKKQAAQPVPEIEGEWNVNSSKFSTVGKDSWNVSSSKYSTVGKEKGKSRR